MTGSLALVRRGEGIPLIAIHGNGVDHKLLLALDDCLAASRLWERVYLDLPGFGGAQPLDGVGGLPELADWLVETVGELVGERPFDLVTHRYPHATYLALDEAGHNVHLEQPAQVEMALREWSESVRTSAGRDAAGFGFGE